MKWAAPAVFGLAVLSAAARPTAAKPACDPVAIVDGDPVLVSSLSVQLVRRGIAIDEAIDSEHPCPAVRATIAQDGGAVSVTVIEAGGQKVACDVTTTEIAAIWIESRMRRDVGSPLLAVRVPLAVNPGPAPGSTVPLDVEASAAFELPMGRDRVSLGARIESATGDEDSSWRAYSASVCVRAGPLCVGALGRLGASSGADNNMFTPATRNTWDLLVTAAWPLRAGRLTILPEIGAGYGSITTRQLGVSRPPHDPIECEVDPELPPELCEAPPQWNATTSGGRLSAGLTLVIPLHDRIALDIGLGAEMLLGAHADPYSRDDMPLEPCPPDGADPSMCDNDSDPILEYPGEPSRLFRAGIGLRLGLP